MTEIKQVLDAYVAAVRAKDVDAFVSLYEDDVRVFDLWGTWSYDGIDAWRAMAAGWFGSLGDEQVAVELEEVRQIVSADVAVVHAFITYANIPAAGEPAKAMNNRVTWTLRRGAGGTWKIAHEHTSAPVDDATSQVMLAR